MSFNHHAAASQPPGMLASGQSHGPHRSPPQNSRPKRSGGMRGTRSNEVWELVEKVKAAQKTGEAVRTQWRDYCDTFGNGTRDPSKHGAAFLLRFFELQAVGDLPVCQQPIHERPMPGHDCDPREAHAILVAKVKFGRQLSRDFNAAWRSFCATSPVQKTDPECHDINSMGHFLTFCVSGNGCFPDKNPYSAPPPFKASPLAETVKSMQSSRLAWKHQWDSFCDSNGNGVRDPGRHPPAFLQQFIDSIAPTSSQGRQILRAGARGVNKQPVPSTGDGQCTEQRTGLRAAAEPFTSGDEVCTDWHPLKSKPSIDGTTASNDDTASNHTFNSSSSGSSPTSRQRSHSVPARMRDNRCTFRLPPGCRVRNTFIELFDSSLSGF